MIKFSIGDRVERINCRNVDHRLGVTIPVGSKGTVVSFINGQAVRVDWDGLVKNSYSSVENLKLYRRVPIQKGDVVVNVSDEDCDIKIGGRYKVILAHSGRIEFFDDDGDLRYRDASDYRVVSRSAPDVLTSAPERTVSVGKTASIPVETKKPTTGTYIVVRAEDGKLLPNAQPVIHFTAEDAKKEAARLAGKHGGTFLVMAPVFRSEGIAETTYVVRTTSV